MIAWIVENSLLTTCVMLVVFALCRLNRKRPALCHLLWVLAFVSLIMPPVPIVGAPGSQLRAQLTGWLQAESGPDAAYLPTAPPAFAGELDEVSLGTASPIPTVTEFVEPTPAAAPSWLAQVSLAQWLIGAWALGACMLCGLAAYRILRFNRLVRSAPAASASLREVVEEVAQRLGLSVPGVRLMEGTGSPAIWCFGPPLLLWPTQSGKVVRHEGERSLIAHELAHVARRDHWVSRLDVLAIGLCWWNPLFWIIRHEVRHYAELSCDAWALWAYPTCRRDFAEALIESQERTQSATMAIEGLCATNSEFKNSREETHDDHEKERFQAGLERSSGCCAVDHIARPTRILRGLRVHPTSGLRRQCGPHLHRRETRGERPRVEGGGAIQQQRVREGDRAVQRGA